MTRVSHFVKGKYNALVDYLYYEAPPRMHLGRPNANRVMQAPIDDDFDEEARLSNYHHS